MFSLWEIILIIDSVIISLFILLFVLGYLAKRIDKRLNPHYPQCDIDPRCSPLFVWDENGNGWIGEYLVVPSNRLLDI